MISVSRIRLAATFAILIAAFGCGSGDGGVPAFPNHVEEAGGDVGSPTGTVPGGGYPMEIVDAAGRALTFRGPPRRIVSLVPSATLALLALKAQAALVGRTEYDAGSALAHLPSVGRGLEPNLESLILLEPDLVIRFAGEADPSTPRRLDDLGIPHMAVRPDRMADVRSLLMDLGTIVGSRERADSLLSEIDATLSGIRLRVGQLPRIRVAYVLGGNPPWVAGPGTFIDELLSVAGGINPFSDLEALYGPVSPEEFLIREIDVIFVPEGTEVRLPSHDIPIIRVSSDVELPGPNLAQSALELAKLLHPEVFR